MKDFNDFLQTHRAVLNKLTAFMLEYNKHTNLTRITEHSEIVEKHYIDSILPLILLGSRQADCSAAEPPTPPPLFSVPRGTSVLDVGSGAGFPGIPMKLFRPDLDVTLLDSSTKRTAYLNALLKEIQLDCRVITGRSEQLAHNSEHRERYRLVIARAVANLPALCEHCLPFVQVGGAFLAMKGGEPETAAAANAMRLLGGELEDVIAYTLPSGDKRSLVVIRKASQTSTAYPRKRVNITKAPIA